MTSSLSHCMVGHRALIRWNNRSGFWSPGLSRWLPPCLCHGCPRSPPCPGLAHLQGQLVSEEGADEVAGVSANPAQEEPHGQRLVHVARLAGLDVLAVAERETHAQSGAKGRDVTLTSRRLPDETATGQWGRSSRRQAGRLGAHPSCRQGPREHYSHSPPVETWGFYRVLKFHVRP